MTKYIVLLCLSLGSCTFNTEYGECIGAFEDEKSELKYEVSTQNAIVGLLFIETLVVPTVIALEATKCPVGKR